VKRQKGATLVEFIIVLPVFLMFMTGILDFSIVLYDKAQLKNASRQGARYGIVHTTPSYATTTAVANYAKTYTTNLISFAPSAPTVSSNVTQSSATPQFGDTLTVTLTYVYTRLTYLTSIGLSSTVTLTATTTMTYE
jgi:Flp pilus assembly protein TadG